MSFHTKLISLHTPWYVIIPTIVSSYRKGIYSYQYMSFHTIKVSIHTSTCHCILVLFHTKTCHCIALVMSSYQQLSVHTIQVCHHTHKCHFIPMKCVWPSALYLRLLTTQPEITRYPLGYFFAMYTTASGARSMRPRTSSSGWSPCSSSSTWCAPAERPSARAATSGRGRYVGGHGKGFVIGDDWQKSQNETSIFRNFVFIKSR